MTSLRHPLHHPATWLLTARVFFLAGRRRGPIHFDLLGTDRTGVGGVYITDRLYGLHTDSSEER